MAGDDRLKPHERIIGLYDVNATEWDRQRCTRLIEDRWLEQFVTLLHGKAILDIGCGSGEPIAGHLVRHGLQLTGVDSSVSLIAMCRDRFPGQEWLVGDMRSLDLDRRFDGLIAWHSLFHLTPDDQRAMFARFAAHSKARAPLLFTTGPQAGEVIGEWQGEPLYHSSLAPEDYLALLADNGFRLVDRNLDDAGCGGASVWLAQMSPASGLDGSA